MPGHNIHTHKLDAQEKTKKKLQLPCYNGNEVYEADCIGRTKSCFSILKKNFLIKRENYIAET